MSTQGAKGGDSHLKVAGEVVGLLGAAVAGIYLLGGLVLAVRLLSDGFDVDAVVSLLGQAPREMVISAGLVQAIGPAVVIGIGAAFVYGARNGPAPPSETGGDRFERRTKACLVGLCGALVVPAVALGIATGELSRGEIAACAVAFVVSIPLVFTGWFLKRRVAQQVQWDRLNRAVAGGTLWAGMALVPTVVAIGMLPFQPAQLCLKGDGQRTAARLGAGGDMTLIVQTNDRTVLAYEKRVRPGQKAKSILTLPTSEVSRLQFGETTGYLLCSGGF